MSVVKCFSSLMLGYNSDFDHFLILAGFVLEQVVIIDCQLNITMQGVQLTRTIEVIGLSFIQLTIAGCRLWASKRAGATFTVGANVLSVTRWVKKIN